MSREQSQNVKKYYNTEKENYFKGWSSLSKQLINDFELDFIAKRLKKLIDRDSYKKIDVLELGIGPGRVMGYIIKFDINYWGVDISEKMVDICKNRFSLQDNVKKISAYDISDELPYEDKKFDFIIAWRMLYYIKDWRRVIRNVYDRLNPGGVFLFTMPNKYSTSFFSKIYHRNKLNHAYQSTYKELSNILTDNNFAENEIIGYSRIPDIFYDKCNSERSAKLLKMLEKIFDICVGEIFFKRMFYVKAGKPEK